MHSDISESQRLAVLRKSGLLDSAPDVNLDGITELAADIFGVPVALVSLVDEYRQWFKSNHGLTDVTETPRNVAFCSQAIMSSDVMVVTNAEKDPRVADNPLVTGEPNIRFYAGAPIIAKERYALGTLCLIDFQPREFSHEEKLRLISTANIARDLLERAAAPGFSEPD